MEPAAQHRTDPAESALGVPGWRIVECKAMMITPANPVPANQWTVADILLGCVVYITAPTGASSGVVRGLVTVAMYKMLRERMIELTAAAALAARADIEALTGTPEQ